MSPIPKDPQWIESLQRMARVNRAEERRRLWSLTLEEGLEQFEQLLEESDELVSQLEEQFGPAPPRTDHPVGLIRFWKLP